MGGWRLNWIYYTFEYLLWGTTRKSTVYSLLWTIHVNTYGMTVKLAASTSISPVCSQCSQHTETMIHALIDCQPIGLYWINVFTDLDQIG
jgi:hypothetical protein